MLPIKLVCQDVTHLAAILTFVKAKFCLFVLRLNVPVNNFSVMSGQSHSIWGVKCLTQGLNTAEVGCKPQPLLTGPTCLH